VNLYAYVEGQVLEATDPSGMAKIGCGKAKNRGACLFWKAVTVGAFTALALCTNPGSCIGAAVGAGVAIWNWSRELTNSEPVRHEDRNGWGY
jgi:hypothetical protein